MKFRFTGIKNFFRDISNFFTAGSVLGIDIGTSSIKIAEVSDKGEKLYLNNYGMLETRDYLDHTSLSIQNSSLDVEVNETANLLKTLLDEFKPASKTALVSIPSFASFVTLVDMPMLSREETSQSINYQAKQYIPMDISEVSVDWFQVDRYKTSRGKDFQRVLLVGIPNRVIESYKSICKLAGLNVVMMELDSIALVRAFSSFNAPTLVIDIGAESTLISVTEGHTIKFSSQIDYGGIHLTRGISQSLDLDMSRSDKLKQRKGLLGKGGDSELSTLIMPFLDVIIQEVGYVRKNYEERYRKDVKQLVLVGGGSNLIGIEDYFSNQLDLPIVPGDTLVDISYPGQIEPAVKTLKKELPISIGLTKKYFTD